MIPCETVLSQKDLGMKVDPHTSDFRVLQSGGGWYIGTVLLACGNTDCGLCEEYVFGGRVLTQGQELDHMSRETDYFDSKEKADDALETYKKTGELPGQRY